MFYNVSIIKKNVTGYPESAPFNPPSIFPELTNILIETDEKNEVYEMVRDSFKFLGYDEKNFGTSGWNPLGWLIKENESVFIKPNMIAHKHSLNEDWNYVITNGSVIRPVIDYVYKALNGTGKIMIGDSPQTDSIIELIWERMGLFEIKEFYKKNLNFDIELIDLRNEYWLNKDGIIIDKKKLNGDPNGKIEIDLKNNSYFTELDGQDKKYYGAYYDFKETNEHHKDGKHEYCVSKSPVIADVFINIPKLKSHKKCGLTVNLKSLVGINADKNWLPHYIFGSPEKGGDQFPEKRAKSELENLVVIKIKNILLKNIKIANIIISKIKKFGYVIFGSTEKEIRSGNWYGNDTVWRMSLDLNRILMYSNKQGILNDTGKLKKYFSVVDGIISMEGNGPVAGTPLNTGFVISGDNPVSVDAVCAKLMGFDSDKIKIIKRAFDKHKYSLISGNENDVQCLSNNDSFNKKLNSISVKDIFHFKPHFGWIGKIELDNELQ
jgi:uncharacterized protein (DUF362 family)